jgi:hypothetical protein
MYRCILYTEKNFGMQKYLFVHCTVLATSRGRAVSVQVLNNKSQEAVNTSTSDLHPGEDRALLKMTVLSSGDGQRKVEWPRKRNPVVKGYDEEENKESITFRESVKAMA